MPVVAAIRDDGRREIVAVDVADTESEATYHDLSRRLKQRGLAGVRLVTSDDHAGLRAAIARHFQGASWQRRQIHFARRLPGVVGASRRQELAAGLRQVLAAATLEQALAGARQLAGEWRGSHPKVAAALAEDPEPCLACLAFPLAHRPRLRTTNGLERVKQERKRRTRVGRSFPNRGACLRLVSALYMEQSEGWLSGRRYRDLAEIVAAGAEQPRA